MLPSIRHFLKFIDCYDKFDQHGFIHKVRPVDSCNTAGCPNIDTNMLIL